MKAKNLGANRTEIQVNQNCQIFVSYETPVAAHIGGYFYRTRARFSQTTSRHINQWLDGVKATEKDQTFFDKLLDAHS